MPTVEEVSRSLTGAWELFLDRAGAMTRFDISLDGFWRSFGAIVLVAPSYAFAVLADESMARAADPAMAAESGLGFVIHNGLGLLLDWIALPLILAFLARPLGISRSYGAFIIARNWCAVLAAIPFGAAGLLHLAGFLSVELTGIVMFAALVVVLRYNYLIARRGLDATMGFALGIVVLDFAVSLTLALGLDGLFLAQ